MKLSTSLVLLVFLIICGKVDARVHGNNVRGIRETTKAASNSNNGRNLRKDKGKNKGKQQNNNNGVAVQEEEEENKQSFGEENENLLRCLNDGMRTEYVPTISAFAREDCRGSVFDYLFGEWWPFFDEDDERETLQELLTCVGNSVGCDNEGGGNDNNVPQDREGGQGQNQQGQQGQGPDPTEEMMNCIGNGLTGRDSSVRFRFDAFSCVSEMGNLNDVVFCIGDSIGCDEVQEIEDRFDEDPNGPTPLWPFPDNDNNNGYVPIPEDRFDDGNAGGDKNQAIPLWPPPQGDVPLGKQPSSSGDGESGRREHQTLGDLFDSQP